MTSPHDPLDELLARVPRQVAPSRDLWSAIEADIASSPSQIAMQRPSRRWMQLAAAVVLVLASSVITFFVMERNQQREIIQARNEVTQQLQPVLSAMPVRFDGYESIGQSYEDVHAQLDAEYAKHLQHLPPPVREKVERDIADLRRAAREISTTLAEYPSDPLLQDLLVSTYQREIRLMSEVNTMAASIAAGTDL